MNLKMILSGLLTALTVIVHAQSGAVSAVNFVIEPYLQQVNNDSFHMLWETSLPGKGIVKLGVAELNVLKPKLDREFREETSDVFHQVSVSGLKPDVHYFYQVLTISGKGDTLLGQVTPLSIPDYSRMPVSFTVVGDTQGNPKVWGRIAGLMQRERPSFLIHVGDMVQYGPHKDDWTDEFFRPAAQLFRFYPIYPAIGNHEMNHNWFYQYFCLPQPEWFYTVKKGNVLFVFADTNKDILPGSAQYKKLENLLASAGENWKIVIHHHPVYTSSENSYGNSWFQGQQHGDPNEMHLKKLYETYGVDLVFCGHIHMYERTWPIVNDQIDYENGVTYVTTGGGGGSLDKAAANKTWFSAKTRATHHFLDITITGKHLFAKAIDTTGVAFDSWTITKTNDSQRLNAPLITGTKQYFADSTTVTIENLNPLSQLYYQINKGPLNSTLEKSVKLKLDATATVSAYLKFQTEKSVTAEKKFVKLPVFPATKKSSVKVHAEYVEGDWIWIPDFSKTRPKQTFELDSISLTPIQPRAKDHFAVRFTGSFSVPETNVYRFLLESFDGSKLIIDGKEIIDNDGIHYEISKENFVALEKGIHSFEVQYFDFVRRETLNLWIGTSPEKMRWFNEFIIRK